MLRISIRRLEKIHTEQRVGFFCSKNFDKETRSLALKTEILPSVSGTLILSLKGDVAQIERRMAARQAILRDVALTLSWVY